MKQNKFFSAAIALLLIAFFTISWALSRTPSEKETPITINSVFDLTSNPYPGTFYTHGALEIQGTVTMEVDATNYPILHCFYTFVAPEGTFTVKEHCTFANSPAVGRWKIVSGTGAYENLRGNGSALMPGNQENWVGFIR